MNAFVVDASVAVKWMVDEDFTPQAVRLLDPAIDLYAPAHWLAEAANTLWAMCAVRGQLSRAEMRLRVGRLRTANVATTPVEYLIPTAAEIAVDLHVTIYDSLYLALAARLDLPLVTADRRLVAKTRGSPHEGRTRWIGEAG